MSDESNGHWYRRDGAPCYEVPAKSKGAGGMRAVWISDAIMLELVPSVTTVTSIIEKPALINYFVEQAVMAALTIPRIANESDADFLKRIKTDGKAEAKAAAANGSLIHDACEQLVKTGQCPVEYRPHADAAVAELHRLFPGVNDWIAEKSFAHPLGYGGKVDLHSPSTGIVVDYKTKPGDFSDGKRLDYDQNIQLAAYQVGLGLADHRDVDTCKGTAYMRTPDSFTRCANIFVSRTHPGCVASHVWSADEIAYGWEVFNHALNLWKVLKKYDGSW